MASPSDLQALRDLIRQAQLVLNTVPDPHPSIAGCHELLDAAFALSKQLARKRPDAVSLGAKGGQKTAERGPEYFAKIAAMRKTRAGGRPKKQTPPRI